MKTIWRIYWDCAKRLDAIALGIPRLVVTELFHRLDAGPELLLCLLDKDVPGLLVVDDKIQGVEVHNVARPDGALCIRYGLITGAIVRGERRHHGYIARGRWRRGRLGGRGDGVDEDAVVAVDRSPRALHDVGARVS